MKFKALIDGVHFDPKKGSVKIVLVGASHVSLDELTTLSPKDETIQVTLESEQTKIEVFPLAPTGVAVEPGSREERELEEGRIISPDFPTGADVSITLKGEEAAAKLKEAADRLREGDVEGDEVDGGGQGGIV